MEVVACLEVLESGVYKRNLHNIKDAYKIIEEFGCWFNTIGQFTLVRNGDFHYTNNCVQILNGIKSGIEKITEALTVNTNLHPVDDNCNTYVCKVCSAKIDVNFDQDVYHILENHFLTHKSAKTKNKKKAVVCLPLNHVEDVKIANGSQCLIEDKKLALNSFRFNFVVTYDKSVEYLFYPKEFIKLLNKIEKLPDYSLQCCSGKKVRCILCCSTINTFKTKITNDVSLHLKSKKHIAQTKTPQYVESLVKYHEFWRKEDVYIQSHQIYFSQMQHKMHCDLCYLEVNENPIPHIFSNSHRYRVYNYLSNYNIDETPFGIHLQITGYGRWCSCNSYLYKPCHIVAVPDSFNNSLMESLPLRYIHHTKAFIIKDENVTCSACNLKLVKNVERIREHILSEPHCKLLNGVTTKMEYCCKPCNFYCFTDENWNSHMHNKRHLETRGKNTSEYECISCKLVLFCTKVYIKEHTRSFKDMKAQNNGHMPDTVKAKFCTRSSINSTANELCEIAIAVSNQYTSIGCCCQDIKTILETTFRGCMVYPFGSRMSGLCNHNSDLDLFVDLGNTYCDLSQNNTLKSQVSALKSISQLFRRNGQKFANIIVISTARTPIIKFHHKPTNLSCDLSVRNGLSVENTEFLKFCIRLQPILRPLILLLRTWMDHLRLQEFISHYALTITAIFYMQVKGYMLSVDQLRSLTVTPSLIIDGWKTLCYNNLDLNMVKNLLKPCPEDVTTLLIDYFHYYATFDYNANIVCVLLGRALPKSMFNAINKIPPEMDSLVYKLQQTNDRFICNTKFCIQDPFDLTHNLTKIINDDYWKILCRAMHKHLIDTIK